ncbi:MAG: SpoIIE family protein phosphatase [Oscillospiraceae bacterium]|nr:SpoIIE family protein phosphatase [Oscillospiraceae bacterium]
MIKKFGLTLGGLQQKILNLVLIFLLAMIAVFAAVSVYQAKRLSAVVDVAGSEQQQAIKNVSEETMRQVIEGSMAKTNALQAYIADDMFSDVKSDVAALQSLAEGLFEHRENFEPYPAYLPDPADNGRLTAQVLCEEGVDYKQSEDLGIAAHMSETMVAICENSRYLDNCFFGLADGTHLCVDDRAADKFDENGKLQPFPVRERPWYIGALEAGGLWLSGVEVDTYTGKIVVECAAPVYAHGKLIGVVGADMFLDSMSEYISKSSENGGYVCVINNDGQVIFAPENNGVFTAELSDKAGDIRNSPDKELADFVSAALSEQTELRIVNVNGKDYYMSGSPMNTVGWAVVSFIEKDITEQPTQLMLSEYDRINNEAALKFNDGAAHSRQTTLVMIAAILILGTFAALFVADRIVKPVEHMTRRITEISGTDLAFEMEDIYRTDDEIQVLAESFAKLSERTRDYIEQITRITAEKERIGAELELATRIQADMLPNIFPPFPERNDIDIFASMTPAKEVGGDFYDFFLLDDDHLGLVIADVSGKGVPAALFMMMSKIIVSNFAMMGGSPSKVLEQTNKLIRKNNDEEMFVTIWLGVLEISTGKVTAANAGHEYPMLKKADGKFELFRDKHGFVVGGIDGIKYKEYEFTIEKGGTLFLYTDGVAEATNDEEMLFGTDRMLDALNKDPQADPKTLLLNMKKSVDEFVGEAPQFDDITMLGVKLL